MPDLLKKYYNFMYWINPVEKNPVDEWQKYIPEKDIRAQGQYRCIKEWIQKFAKLNVLEIGAGPALFSRLLKKTRQGNICLSVIEPGDKWEQYYNKVRISLVARFFPFESKRDGSKFNYIHTSHWLEHVYDLSDVLYNIKNLLTRDGLLFVEVPNCDSSYYLTDHADIPHIHFFTKDSLSFLLERYGFKTLTVDEYGLTNQEEQKQRIERNNFDKKIAYDGKISLENNIPRKGGTSLRALFQKTE